MILRILKSNRSVNYLLLLLFGILFWLKNLLFLQPSELSGGNTESPVFSLFAQLTQSNLLLSIILALLVVLFMSLLIQQINNRYNFIRIRTMIPALLFITIIGGFTSLHILYPVYFATIFLLMAIYRSFDAFDHPKPYSAAFDTGFLLGIGSLFYFNFIIIFPAFLFGISILSRNYGWRQFVLLTMGFILPIVFASAYAIYTEQLAELSKGLFRSVTIKNKPESINLPQIVFLGYLIILTVLSSIKIIQQFDTKKVSTRIYFIIFFLLFILSVSGYILIPSASHEMLIITAIPLTFLISNFFVFLNSRLWGEILFSILLIIVISLQFLT